MFHPHLLAQKDNSIPSHGSSNQSIQNSSLSQKVQAFSSYKNHSGTQHIQNLPKFMQNVALMFNVLSYP